MPDTSPQTAPAPVLFTQFTGGEVSAIRRVVSWHAAGVGMHGNRLHDFVWAVNEIVTNAVEHGGGGELRLWVTDRTAECEITSKCSNTAAADSEWAADMGGRGLQLAQLLVDSFDVLSSSGGTAVRLVSELPVELQ